MGIEKAEIEREPQVNIEIIKVFKESKGGALDIDKLLKQVYQWYSKIGEGEDITSHY